MSPICTLVIQLNTLEQTRCSCWRIHIQDPTEGSTSTETTIQLWGRSIDATELLCQGQYLHDQFLWKGCSGRGTGICICNLFETLWNMRYCMIFKPVMKHNTSHILIAPEGVSNYGGHLPIFMEEMIRIWISGSVQLFIEMVCRYDVLSHYRDSDLKQPNVK
jgi:hypothetical protein